MRPTTALLAGLFTQSVAAGPSPCLKEKTLEHNRCHSSQSSDLQACLSNIADNITQQGLRACFEKAGCDSLDARAEARWVIESCLSETELRRRKDEEKEEDAVVEEEEEEDTTTTKKTGKPTSSEEETTTEEKTTRTTTVEAKTTAEPTEETAVQTEVVVATVQAAAADTPGTSVTSTATTSATLAFASTALECFTTITFTTEGYDIINTDSAGRVSRSFNSQKVAAKTRCADGLVCISDGCMVADNTLQGSGIAVAIFFGSAAAVSFFTLIFLCCRDRRKDKQLRAKMEAAKLAKENAKPTVVPGAGRSVSAGRRSPSGADRQPLMNQGMYPPSPGGSQSGRPSHDPFGDQRRV